MVTHHPIMPLPMGLLNSYYDGIWEGDHVGSGLRGCPNGQPSTPHGFILPHCIYLSISCFHQNDAAFA